MAKFKGWKGRYSYLDDYKPGLDGTYVYYGRHYIFKGSGEELRRYKWTLGIADFLFAALFICGGCMDAGAIWRTWYVILPFAIEAIALFLLVWKSLTFITEKAPLKAYIYKKTIPWFRPAGFLLTGACIVSVITTVIGMLILADGIKTAGCILYLVITAVMGALGVVFLKIIGKDRWELDPSEEME